MHRGMLTDMAAPALLAAVSVLAASCGSPSSPVGPSRASAPELTTGPVPANLPAYDRDAWRHWIDADQDCQDTRTEVLIEESLEAVLFRDGRTCVAESGAWVDAYARSTVTVAGQLDVDHLVPLANAHRSGGWAWDDRQP